jgi:hypothetical protein
MSAQFTDDEVRAAHYAGLAHGFASMYAGIIAAELGAHITTDTRRVLHSIGFELGHDACRTLAAAIRSRVTEARNEHPATARTGAVEPDAAEDELRPATDLTVDRVPITPGLRVFTNDCEWGTVEPGQFTRGGLSDPGGELFDGWYSVSLPNGGTRRYDGERLSTRDLDSRPDETSRFPGAAAERSDSGKQL